MQIHFYSLFLIIFTKGANNSDHVCIYNIITCFLLIFTSFTLLVISLLLGWPITGTMYKSILSLTVKHNPKQINKKYIYY